MRVFGACDFSIMAILSRGGNTYGRLQFSAGPGGSLEIPITVDWQMLPALTQLDSQFAQWRQEYEQLVKPMHFEHMELLPEEPTEVLDDIIQPDLLTWRDSLEYGQNRFE